MSLMGGAPLVVLLVSRTVSAQAHMPAPGAWTVGFAGVAFGTLDRERGPRGETALQSQNWFMAMGARSSAAGTLTLTGMLSAEPWSVEKPGYPELLQEGESYQGLQITDHQHPHPFIMQAGAVWRVPWGSTAGVTLAGALVGEPALGPVAFMHRSSSSENPDAPLSHHIFDSTHISTGVVTVGVDRRPFALEGSVFRAREPNNTPLGDLHFGALDSWSARLWFRPSPGWTIQVSHGFLHEPEQLEPGDQRRTNGSISWLRTGQNGFSAVTAALGRTDRRYSTVHALLLEYTQQAGRTFVYSRYEALTVETEILLFPEVVHRPHPGELVDPIEALTVGGMRDVARLRGYAIGVGGDATVDWIPPLLEFVYGTHPASIRFTVRVRLPEPMGRMWDMTFGQPPSMDHHAMHHS